MPEEKQQFAFYSQQFALHTNRIFEYHKERFNIVVLSIGGTFAYYGWFLSTAWGKQCSYSRAGGLSRYFRVTQNLVLDLGRASARAHRGVG